MTDIKRKINEEIDYGRNIRQMSKMQRKICIKQFSKMKGAEYGKEDKMTDFLLKRKILKCMNKL